MHHPWQNLAASPDTRYLSRGDRAKQGPNTAKQGGDRPAAPSAALASGKGRHNWLHDLLHSHREGKVNPRQRAVAFGAARSEQLGTVEEGGGQLSRRLVERGGLSLPADRSASHHGAQTYGVGVNPVENQ